MARRAVENIAPIIATSGEQQPPVVHLTSDGYIDKPLIAETQITKVEVPQRKVAVPKTAALSAKTVKTRITAVSGSGNFPYGYCTYYVAQRRQITWSGNAITWLAGARSAGFATGDEPQSGAILVTSEGGRTGHVAMVDAVGEGTITVSEMNYAGFGVISSRTIPTSYGRIMGYIY